MLFDSCVVSDAEMDSDADLTDVVYRKKPGLPGQQPRALPANFGSNVDPNQLLGTWLGELENLTKGIDDLSTTSQTKLAHASPYLNPQEMGDSLRGDINCQQDIDVYRFSIATLESSQDGELDAILGELCSLGQQFDTELSREQELQQRNCSDVKRPLTLTCGSANRIKLELNSHKADSPDNDSAFSDNVSMLSGESSASSGGSGGSGGSRDRPAHFKQPDAASLCSTANRSVSSNSSSASSGFGSVRGIESTTQSLSQVGHNGLTMLSSPQKMNLFVKVYMTDCTAKSLLIDEKMSAAVVCRLLADKNYITMDPKWTIMEHCPDLYMERIYEDQENVVENLLSWSRESNNRLMFVERADKYDMFINPQSHFLNEKSRNQEVDDECKTALIEEYFSNGTYRVPEVKTYLYLKTDGKKQWRKYYFVLRASGIYYFPKDRSKSAKDLVCLVTFEMNQIYTGFGWKRKYKAPTDYGFAIKHPQIQTRASKYIKYLCAEDSQSLTSWLTAMRIAKYGNPLYQSYTTLVQEIAEADLEQLAQARSASVASVLTGQPLRLPPTSAPNVSPTRFGCKQLGSPEHAIYGRRAPSYAESTYSSISSASSHSRSNSVDTGFEVDSPSMGTIKRKPLCQPKIPLTITTRTLAMLQSDSASVEFDSGSECAVKIRGDYTLPRGGGSSLRRSLTFDRIPAGYATMRKRSLPSVAADLERIFSASQESFIKPNNGGSPEEDDQLPLPPPPEDLGKSLLALDELPPPPPEAYTPSPCSGESRLAEFVAAASCEAKVVPAVPPKPAKVQRAPSDASNSSTCTVIEAPPKEQPSATQAPAEENYARSQPRKLTASTLKRRQTIDNSSTVGILNSRVAQPKPNHVASPTTPKRITFSDTVELYPEQGSPVLIHAGFNDGYGRAGTPQQSGSPVYEPDYGLNGGPYQVLDRSKPQNQLYGYTGNPSQVFGQPRSQSQVNEHTRSPNQIYNQTGGPSQAFERSRSPNYSRNGSSIYGVQTCNQANLPQCYGQYGGNNYSSPEYVRGGILHPIANRPLPSIPAKLPPPPEVFMADLQRVIEKKWSVSRQLVSQNKSLSDFMGFREPFQQEDECCPQWENLRNSSSDTAHYAALGTEGKKAGRKPPPMPPKRSETTQLSTRLH